MTGRGKTRLGLRRGRWFAAAAAAIAGIFAPAPAQAATTGAPTAADHFPAEVVVRFRASADAPERAALRRRLDASLEDTLPLRGVQLLELDGSQSVRGAVAELERAPEVLYAEPNYRLTPDAMPNDPRVGEQWGLRQIGLPDVWETTIGSRDVTAAVLDSGVEIRHPEFTGTASSGPNLWRNPGETGDGREGNDVDDDGNGYVDDWRGWRFADDSPVGGGDPTDYSGHGTHAAGIIGAVGDEGYGMSGVSQRVSIMPLAVWGRGSAGAAEAVTYAARNGARVANGSFGIPWSQAIEDALAASPELLLMVSAGNQGWDVEQNSSERYPCVSTLANVICVAASDQADNFAGWSNWGPESVDLAAPGIDLLTVALPDRWLEIEDFEAEIGDRWAAGGSGGAWARTGPSAEWPGYESWALDDSPGGLYENDADTWFEMTRPVDLTGHDRCSISYWGVGKDLAAGDVFRIEGASEGTGWIPLVEWTGNTGHTSGLTMDELDGRPGFRLRARMITNAEGRARGVRIDNLALYCATVPVRGDEYAFVSGTSFAAPHVTGVAALLLAHRPDLNAAQLRGALLDSVDPVPQMAGRTVTGGRLNARRALEAVSPTVVPPPSPETNAPAPDLRSPRCTLRAPGRQRPRAVGRRGLRLIVNCDEPSTIAARLSLGRRTAKALGLGPRARRVAVGKASGVLGEAGRRALRVRLSRRWARALRGKRTVVLIARLATVDGAGNRRVLKRRVVLTR